MRRFRQRDRRPTFRHFFYSFGVHASIIAFILTLPGYSGSLNTLSLHSLSAFISPAEAPQEIQGRVLSALGPVRLLRKADNPMEGAGLNEEDDEPDDQIPEVQRDTPAATDNSEQTEKPEAGTAPVKVGEGEAQLVAPQAQISARHSTSPNAGSEESPVKQKIETQKGPAKTVANKQRRVEQSQNEREDQRAPSKGADVERHNRVPDQKIVAEEKKSPPEPEAPRQPASVQTQKADPLPLPEEKEGREPAGPEVKEMQKEPARHIPPVDEKRVESQGKIHPDSGSADTKQRGKEAKSESLPKKEKLARGEGYDRKSRKSGPERKAPGKQGVSGEMMAQGQKINEMNEPVGRGVGNGIIQTGTKPGSGQTLGENNISNPGTGKETLKPEVRDHLGRNGGPGRDIVPHGRGRQQQTSEAGRPGVRGDKVAADEKMGMGLPQPEQAPSDIKIEVLLNGVDEKMFAVTLLRRAYPLPEKRPQRKKKEEVNCPLERKKEIRGSGINNILSVSKAENGTFTFIVENKGSQEYAAGLVFIIYEHTPKQRMKEYKRIQIRPGAAARFRFILPDALFWDDEERFSGQIESSTSTTKFLYDSGLVWSEDKD